MRQKTERHKDGVERTIKDIRRRTRKRFGTDFRRECARPEDAERWLEGFRLAGLDV